MDGLSIDEIVKIATEETDELKKQELYKFICDNFISKVELKYYKRIIDIETDYKTLYEMYKLYEYRPKSKYLWPRKTIEFPHCYSDNNITNIIDGLIMKKAIMIPNNVVYYDDHC